MPAPMGLRRLQLRPDADTKRDSGVLVEDTDPAPTEAENSTYLPKSPQEHRYILQGLGQRKHSMNAQTAYNVRKESSSSDYDQDMPQSVAVVP